MRLSVEFNTNVMDDEKKMASLLRFLSQMDSDSEPESESESDSDQVTESVLKLDSESDSDQKPKRKRRTKAEIEAERRKAETTAEISKDEKISMTIDEFIIYLDMQTEIKLDDLNLLLQKYVAETDDRSAVFKQIQSYKDIKGQICTSLKDVLLSDRKLLIDWVRDQLSTQNDKAYKEFDF